MTTYTDVFGSETLPPAGYGYQALSITSNTTLVWPYNATGGTAVSKIIDLTATAGLSLTFPDATLVSTGEDCLIRNVGAETVTLKDSAGGTITTVAASSAKYLYLTDNSTAAGAWGVIAFGVGSSAVDAGTLVGYGLMASGATLNVASPVSISATGVTIDGTYRGKTFVFTGGADTLALTAVATIADNFFVLVKNNGTGTLTINPDGAELIDGVSSLGLQPGESLILVCSGAAWYTVGYGRAVLYQFSQLVKDVSAAGTITLTASEASNKLLKFTGNPASDLNVVVPNTVAVYYTQSAISTAKTITLKTAAGTGVAITQTQQVISICDGTNVVNAQSLAATANITYLDGSAASPSANFASSTNTGFFLKGTNGIGFSANGVEVGSATTSGFVLITPALGTPASGTLTSCTGLPIATGVSGLGTGVAAALAVNVGSAGAPVLFNGAGGTPSALTGTNITGMPSTGLTFLQAGTGATSRTGQAKLRDTVGVKDFGATGDGVTDDSTAIQAALDSGAGHVHFPDGNYLLSTGLTLPTTSCRISFGRLAILLAGANNIKVFSAPVTAYLTVIESPRINGNTKTGVTAFELVHFSVGSVIRDAYITACATGIYFKQLCGGGVIENPAITNTTNPIIIKDGSNTASVINPQIDSDGSGSDGGAATAGIAISGGPTYDTTSARVVDGSVQGFKYGITDTSTFGTIVRGTYFERNPTADVLLTSSICPIIDGSQHFASIGVVGIKGVSTSGVRVLNTIMSSAGRSTGMLDFDGTNVGAKYDFLNTGGASLNLPLGTTTGISPMDLKVDFSSSVALTFATAGDLAVTYSSKVASYTRQGGLVFYTIEIATSSFTHTTASGALKITGLPFTADTLYHIGACALQGWTKAGYSNIVGYVNPSTTSVQFTASGSGQALAGLTAADMPTGGAVVLYLSGSYAVA